MAEAKPIASLSPRLLARKGGARPAMRSQASAVMISHEDLGWNDMGHDQEHMGEVVPIAPETSFNGHLPEVVRQQRAMVGRFDSERRSALADGRRAAFTLRVDAERHLKLRLACTVQGRSAQQLVTQALDALLDSLPDVTDLAAQVAKKRH
jgi:predicted HicB family RNase H-like nuclease